MSKSDPHFDIILPTVCRYALRDAILSVLAQTYPRWLLYVISDGVHYPGDADLPVDNRIRYLYLPERYDDIGATPRNTGIDLGTSEWIAYIDDDDRWLPHHLQHHADLIRSSPGVSMSRSSGQIFLSRRRHPRTKERREKLGAVNTTDILTVGMVHTRELFSRTGGWSCDPKDREVHDRKLWNDMLAAGGVAIKSEEVTFRFLR